MTFLCGTPLTFTGEWDLQSPFDTIKKSEFSIGKNLSTEILVCFIGMRGTCHVFALFVVMWACLCSQVTAGPDCPYGWVKQGRSCYFAATAWTRYVDLYGVHTVTQESHTTLNGSSHGMW